MADYNRVKVFVALAKLFAAELNAEFDAIKAAINNIDSTQLNASSVITSTLANLAVTAGKLASMAVTSGKIGFTSVMPVPFDYVGTGRVSGAIIENNSDSSIFCKSARLISSVAPVGSLEEIKMTTLANTYLDLDADSGNDIVFTGGNPQLPDGVKKGSKQVVFSGGELMPGEAWVFNAVTVGSTTGAGEVTMAIEIGRS